MATERDQYLATLKSAISDVGRWTWWTADLPRAFQIEFSGVQLWNPPPAEGKPPSGQIALLFRKPRLIYFLTFSDAMSPDWPDRLQRDELRPFNVDHEEFTLTQTELCSQFVARATAIRALAGEPGKSPLPVVGELFLAFAAGPVGLVVAAESMVVLNHLGELNEQAVVENSRKWWEYWREYWRRKDTAEPMPKDFACEITIPAG